LKSKIIFKNYFTKILSTLVSLVIGFVVTPFLLKYLGKNDFALFKLTSDWLSSFSVFENALSIAILAVFAKSTDENRDQNAWYSFKSYYKYSIIFTLISMCVIPFLPYLYYINPDRLRAVQIAFFLGSLNFLLLPFAALRCWLEFKEKSYLLSTGRIYQNLIVAITSMLFSYLTFGVIGQFGSVLLGNVFFAFMVYFLFNKFKSINVTDKISKLNLKTVNTSIHQLNLDGLLISFFGRMSFLTDSVLLGLYFHPTKLLPFILTQRLIQMIQDNLQSIGNASWASLLDLFRTGEQFQFQKNLITITRVSNFMAVSLLSPLLILNKSFISLWVGPEFYYGLSLTIIASINAYLRSTFSLWGWCLSGNGNTKVQIKIEAFNAFVNIVSSIVLIQYIAFLGPVVGTLLGCVLIYSLMFPLAMKSNLNLEIIPLYKSLLIPISWAIPIYFILLQINKYLVSNTWIKFILSYGILGLVTLLIVYFLGLNIDEKNYFTKIIKSKIKK
jgi:O-antigen/teichoic acid export membrane protein